MSVPENHSVEPCVKVELGGESRTLLFNNNALIAIEERTGRNMLVDPFPENMSAKDVRLYTWAALLHSNPKLELETVGSWIELRNVMTVLRALGEAFAKALPPVKPVEGGNEPPLVQ
jgi:hypothetical protein